MFWIFRRRNPLKPAHFYLDVAAGILQARSKCEGKSIDDWGRVDAVGAMRISVWGVAGSEEMTRLSLRRNGPVLWEKYDDVKVLMHQYLANNHERHKGAGRDKSFMNGDLWSWSDTTPQHVVVEWMKKAAREAAVAAREV